MSDKTSNKMQWFLDAYCADTLDDKIGNCGVEKGTIVLPTGGGKSGLIYTHILRTMEREMKLGSSKKIVFNISAPILKLEAQLLNDFIDVIRTIFTNVDSKIKFYINSSANSDAYDLSGIGDSNGFDGIDRFFVPSEPAQFALVASCHKSLDRFAGKLDFLKQNAMICTYLDEAHLVISNTDDYERTMEERPDGEIACEIKERINTLEKLCESDYIYAITATPDKNVTSTINKMSNKPENFIAVKVTAREKISENVILPPNPMYAVADGEEHVDLTSAICVDFMNKVKTDNPNINHKVLVTCKNSKHLNDIKTELEKTHKVFSTCSAYGAMTNGNEEIADSDFIKEVDEYDGDCFVLHIKQLIQGIDVSTLTDCIIYNSSTLQDRIKRKIIQTIGRILRPLAGERGMDISKRRKKYGNVLFLVGGEWSRRTSDEISGFMMRYYGLNDINFFTSETGIGTGNKNNTPRIHLPSSGLGNGYGQSQAMKFIFDELVIDMKKYILKEIHPQWKRHCDNCAVVNKKPNMRYLRSELENMKDKFKYFRGTYRLVDVISDTEFMELASKFIDEASENVENYIEGFVK